MDRAAACSCYLAEAGSANLSNSKKRRLGRLSTKHTLCTSFYHMLESWEITFPCLFISLLDLYKKAFWVKCMLGFGRIVKVFKHEAI